MDEFSNPYRPGAGTSPPALLGRDVADIAGALAYRNGTAARRGS